VNPALLLDLIVERNVRPERPDHEDAPQLLDAIWQVVEQCWVKDPKCRPTASTVCDSLLCLLDTTAITPSLALSHTAAVPASATIIIQPPFAPQLHVPFEPSSDQRQTANAILNTPDTMEIAQPAATLSTSHPTAPPLVMPLLHRLVKPHPDHPISPLPNLTLQGHTDKVFCATFSPDGKYIVSGSEYNTIMLWDTQTGILVLGPLKKHTSCVSCVAFSPDGRQITSGSWDYTILVWDAMTGKVVAGPFGRHTNIISSVSFSPDGKQIASGSWDGKIRVWDAQTGDCLAGPLTGHTWTVHSVAFSGDGTRLVSGSHDKTVRVWNAGSGQLIYELLEGHTKPVVFVAFSPYGGRIVSADENSNVCIWDTATRYLVSGPSKLHAQRTLAVVFTSSSTDYCAVSPDGEWIAHKCEDLHTIEVLHSATGRFAAKCSDHTGWVSSVSFSPDSKWFLTASDDKTIHVHALKF
jgi:WD40 repeat protein